jgi:hypothetical protein
VSIIRLCNHAGITTRSQPPSTFNYIYSNRSQPSGDQVATVPKIATQDTTLTVNNIGGGKTTFPVPSGTEIYLQVPGLHFNRRLSGLVPRGQVFMKFRSAVLEGASQVHARTVPWGLAEGCLYSIQSRYI